MPSWSNLIDSSVLKRKIETLNRCTVKHIIHISMLEFCNSQKFSQFLFPEIYSVQSVVLAYD